MGDPYGGNIATILISISLIFYVAVVIIKLSKKSIKCTYCKGCNVNGKEHCNKNKKG